LPILLFAPLYNVPRFFEFKTATNITYTCLRNSTLSGGELIVQEGNSSLENIVLEAEEFEKMSSDEQINMCLTWNRKSAVELVVTDFRVNPTYVTVLKNELFILHKMY